MKLPTVPVLHRKNSRLRGNAGIWLAAAFLLTAGLRASPEPVSFYRQVLPILRQNCVACHNESRARGDLDLETHAKILEGIEGDPVIVPGKADESLLYQVSAHLEKPVMPPPDNKAGARKLTEEELEILSRWIDEGAREDEKPVTETRPEWQPLPSGLLPIYAVALSPDGQTLAGSRANRIFVHDLERAEHPTRLTDPGLIGQGLYDRPGVAHLDLVQALAFHPSGAILASGGYRVVKLWKRELAHRASRLELPGPAAGFTAVVSVGGDRWVTGHSGGRLAAWQDGNPAPRRVWLSPGLATITTLALEPSTGHVLVGTAGGTLERLDPTVESGTVQPLWPGLPGAITSLLPVPGTDRIVMGTASGQIFITPGENPPAADESPEKKPPAPRIVTRLDGPVLDLEWVPGPPTVLIATSRAGDAAGITLDLARVEASRIAWEIETGKAALDAAIDPSGQRLALALEDSPAELWDLGKRERISILARLPESSHRVRAGERALGMLEARRERAGARVKEREKELTAREKELEKTEKALAEAEGKLAAAVKIHEEREAALKALESSLASTTGELAGKRKELETHQKVLASEREKEKKTARELDEARKKLAALPETGDPTRPDLESQIEKLGKSLEATRREIEKSVEDEKGLRKVIEELVRTEAETKKKIPPARKQRDDQVKALEKVRAEVEKARAPVELNRDARELVTGYRDRARESLAAIEARIPPTREALEAARKVGQMPAPVQPVRLRFTADGEQLLALESGQLHVFRAGSGEALPSRAMLDAVQAGDALLTTATADSWRVITSDGADLRGEVHPAWKLERQIGSTDGSSPFADRVLALAFSPDGSLLATGGGAPARNGEVIIWDTRRLREVRRLETPHADSVFTLAFSPDGEYLATGGADKMVRLFEVETGRRLRTFEGHTHHVLGVSWQVRGELLASAGADPAIKVWNVSTGEQARSIGGFGQQVTALGFLGETTHTVACSGDRSVRIHDAGNGKQIRSLGGSADYQYALGISHDGRRVASGGFDGVLRVWETEKGKLLHSLEAPRPGEQKPTAAATP